MRSFLYLRVFGALEQVGKIGPKYTNQGQGYTESNSKYSTPHFKSNDTQLKCKGHSKVELYLL